MVYLWFIYGLLLGIANRGRTIRDELA